MHLWFPSAPACSVQEVPGCGPLGPSSRAVAMLGARGPGLREEDAYSTSSSGVILFNVILLHNVNGKKIWMPGGGHCPCGPARSSHICVGFLWGLGFLSHPNDVPMR